MDGTAEAWLTCLEEDIAGDVFNFNEFIIAVNEAIREPVYNRIDYSDFYARAKSKAHTRKVFQNDREEERQRERSSTVDISMRRPLSEIKRLMNGEDL